MTEKIRIRLDNHILLEAVIGGIVLHEQLGHYDIQEDVSTYTYEKRVLTDKEKFLECMKTYWEERVHD